MMEKEMKIGFIGFGKMAMAIAEGWNQCDIRPQLKLYAYAPSQQKLKDNCARLHVEPCQDPEEVCKQADILILACKPQQVPGVLESVQDSLDQKLVVSLAAGISFEKLEAWIPGVAHVSIMPNLAVAVRAGTIIVEDSNTMSAGQRKDFDAIFSPLALVETVGPGQFSVAGIISGCSPAFLGLYAEALADAGVKYGLSRSVAARLSAQAVYGAGAMLSEEGREPAVFKNDI